MCFVIFLNAPLIDSDNEVPDYNFCKRNMTYKALTNEILTCAMFALGKDSLSAKKCQTEHVKGTRTWTFTIHTD